jgi:hypothetical protein
LRGGVVSSGVVEEFVDIVECVEVDAARCGDGAYAPVSAPSEHGASSDVVGGGEFGERYPLDWCVCVGMER